MKKYAPPGGAYANIHHSVRGLLVGCFLGFLRSSIFGIHGNASVIVFLLALGNSLLVTFGRPLRMLDVPQKVEWMRKEVIDNSKPWCYQIAFVAFGVIG